MKKLLSIALSLILTLQASAQAQSGPATDSNAQNGKERHFDIASHLRQLKITEMNNQARMKREQQSAALRTAAPVRKSPDSMQPKAPASMKSKAPVSMQPKAPARKASPVASAKPRSAANNGGYWKYKEKLDSIIENNGNTKRTFEYDYDGNITKESAYELQNGKTWSLSETYEYKYEDNVIKSKIHYYDYWDGLIPNIKRTFEYDYDGNVTKEFSYRLQSDKTWSLDGTYEYEYEDNVIKSKIYYYDYKDGLIPNSKTKTAYVRMPSGDSREFNIYQWNGDDWVVETPETTVEYDGEGRLTYYESPRTSYKIEYYYDENGDYHYMAQYMYINEKFICTYLVTLDKNNRVISKEEYGIADWETGERQGIYKYEYAYDENGNQVQKITYSWDSEKEEWVTSGKHEWYFILNESGEYESRDKARYEVVNGEFICTYLVTLDGNNRVISKEEYNITDGGTGEKQGNYKYEYAYDENGNQVQEITYSWDSEKKEWVASGKHEWYFILNESGEYESHDKACYEVVNGEFICTYLVTLDENNRVTSKEEYITDWETGERQENLLEYAYGEDGTCTITNYLRDGENSQWYEHPKSITAYDKNGKQTLYEEYTLEYGVWYGDYKDEYAYDENGNQIMQAHYWWDRENEKWYGVYTKEEHAYDENGNQIMVAFYNWDSGNDKWIGNSKYEYAYDENGNQIMSAYYTWDNENDKWKGESKEEIVYDDKGYRHITDQYSNWDSEYDCFKNWEHHYYNPRFQLVGYTYYEYDGNEYVAKSGIKIETDEHGEIVKSTNVENPETGKIYENTYNDKNQLTRQVCISFNGETKEKYTSTEFSYDENGRISLEAVSTWNGTEWVLSSKTEYNYEAYDTYNAYIYQETTRLIAGEWRCTTKQGALKLNEGYKVFGDNWNSVNYYYDDNTGVLTNCYGYENTYDAKSNQMSYVEFSGATEDGQPKIYSYQEYAYIFNQWGEKGGITIASFYWDWDTSQFVHSNKYTKKTTDGVTLLTIQKFNGEEWEDESRYELEYDEDGTLISSAQFTLLDAQYSGNESEEWTCVYKQEYEYDENGNMTADLYECKELSDKHEYRYTYFYNTETGSYDQKQTKRYNYFWNGENWVGNGNASEWEYDENGNQVQEITYSWDSEANDWKNNQKGLYAYDENGNRTLEEKYSWDSEKGDWVASSKSEWYFILNESGEYESHDKARYEVVNGEFVCTYIVEVEHGLETSNKEYQIIDEENGTTVCTCDEEYRLFYNAETESYERMETKYYHWYWNGEKLVGNGDAREKEYDDFGNITKETSFRWNSENDEWYIQNQSSYTFDTNVLTADIAMKEGEYSQYNGKCKLLSLESSEYHEWESSYYDNKKEYFYSVFGYYYYVDCESHEIIPDPDGDEFVGEDLTLIDKQTYSANTDFTVGNLTYKRTFVDSEWNALYVPFNIPVEALDEEGLQAAEILTVHVYDDDQDGTVDHTTIEVVPVISGELEANVPYVVRAKELEGEKEVEITLTDALVLKSDNNSIDCSSTKQLFTFTGSYEPISGETLFNDGLYYLGIDSETSHVAIVKAESEETKSLPAQRWSLAITDRKGNPVDSHVRAIDIIMDENATGIAAVGIGSESETDVYNVAGVRVATLSAGQSIKSIALPAGVYVSKGHKFIIK